jgi:hypothetical protein
MTAPIKKRPSVVLGDDRELIGRLVTNALNFPRGFPGVPEVNFNAVFAAYFASV